MDREVKLVVVCSLLDEGLLYHVVVSRIKK